MLYEMLTIWPGGEYVHFSTEDKKAIAARYNRCRAQDVAVRIRRDGYLLTIREADELCGQAWERMPEYKRPQVIRHKKTGGLPPAKRKPVAEMDSCALGGIREAEKSRHLRKPGQAGERCGEAFRRQRRYPPGGGGLRSKKQSDSKSHYRLDRRRCMGLFTGAACALQPPIWGILPSGVYRMPHGRNEGQATTVYTMARIQGHVPLRL